MSKDIIIVTAVDRPYLNFLLSLLGSIKFNSIGRVELVVLYRGLSSRLLEALQNIVYDALDLRFVCYSTFARYLPQSEVYFHEPYFWRLIAPEIFAETKRILYLDIDTNIRQDLTELFNLAEPDHTVYASIDCLKKISVGVNNWDSLHLDPEEHYFNSGVLLINTRRFLEKSIKEKVFLVMKNNRNQTKAQNKWEQHDQYGLNVALYKDWGILPQEFNYRSELEFADCKVVHFLGNGKPWLPKCTTEYKHEYYSNLRAIQNTLDRVNAA